MGIRDTTEIQQLVPRITGVEVTQAIQFFQSEKHLDDPGDYGRDNSLEIVAGKPLYIRVYVAGGLEGGGKTFLARATIDRKLIANPVQPIFKIQHVGRYSCLAPLRLTSFPDYLVQRLSIAQTLNIVVPAEEVWGLLQVKVEIYKKPSLADVLNRTINIEVAGSSELTVLAGYSQSLRVRMIPITYQGPGSKGVGTLSLAAPTLADLLTTLVMPHRLLPVASVGSHSAAGGITLDHTLEGDKTRPGGCSQGFNDLLDDIEEAKDDDGNQSDVIYMGLLPTNVPFNESGCEGNGVTGVVSGDGFAAAHEIAHAAGLKHAPGCVAGDDTYPTYEPYMADSIGEFGLDITTGEVHQPSTHTDIMTYCSTTNWISIFTHRKLIPNPTFLPWYVGPHINVTRPPIRHAPWSQRKPRELISIIARRSLTGSIHVHSSRRVTTVASIARGAVATSLVAQLIGANQEVLVEAPMYLSKTSGVGCDCANGSAAGSLGGSLRCYLPNLAVGLALRILDTNVRQENGEFREVWRRDAPPRKPTIGAIKLVQSRRQLTLQWQARTSAKEPPRYSVQLSRTRGRTWEGLASGLSKARLVVPLASLPDGNLIFRVVVHDGFHSVFRSTASVRVAARPPQVVILYPTPETKHRGDIPLRLQAVAYGREVIDPSEGEVLWTIDARTVATAMDSFIAPPEKGMHTARVSVGKGRLRTTATVRFKIV